MEPWLGYCRECRQTWPCLYEQGRADEKVRIERLILGISCDTYCDIHDEHYDLPCSCLRGYILAEIKEQT